VERYKKLETFENALYFLIKNSFLLCESHTFTLKLILIHFWPPGQLCSSHASIFKPLIKKIVYNQIYLEQHPFCKKYITEGSQGQFLFYKWKKKLHETTNTSYLLLSLAIWEPIYPKSINFLPVRVAFEVEFFSTLKEYHKNTLSFATLRY